ncbi:MAG: NAD(P)-dependent oxidoreductase [Pirellulales bacterium]
MKSIAIDQWGLIGIGLMGTSIAKRLRHWDQQVVGWDPDPARRAALAEIGGCEASSSSDVFHRCDVLLLSLPNSSIASQVIEEHWDALRPSTLLIDTTTGDPQQMLDLGERIHRGGKGTYVEACISGSSQQLEHGLATILLGGDSEPTDRIATILESYFGHVIRTGQLGTGSKAKLLTNLVLGLNRAALAEGLYFATLLGIEPNTALHLLQSTMAYSRIMDTKGSKMVNRDFSPVAKLSQHRKDVLLMLDSAREQNAQLPLTQTHAELLQEAMQLGWGDEDNSAILNAWLHQAKGD